MVARVGPEEPHLAERLVERDDVAGEEAHGVDVEVDRLADVGHGEDDGAVPNANQEGSLSLDKAIGSPAEAVEDVPDGASPAVGGFGLSGIPACGPEARVSPPSTRRQAWALRWPVVACPGGMHPTARSLWRLRPRRCASSPASCTSWRSASPRTTPWSGPGAATVTAIWSSVAPPPISTRSPRRPVGSRSPRSKNSSNPASWIRTPSTFRASSCRESSCSLRTSRRQAHREEDGTFLMAWTRDQMAARGKETVTVLPGASFFDEGPQGLRPPTHRRTVRPPHHHRPRRPRHHRCRPRPDRNGARRHRRGAGFPHRSPDPLRQHQDRLLNRRARSGSAVPGCGEDVPPATLVRAHAVPYTFPVDPAELNYTTVPSPPAHQCGPTTAG